MLDDSERKISRLRKRVFKIVASLIVIKSEYTLIFLSGVCFISIFTFSNINPSKNKDFNSGSSVKIFFRIK